MIYEILVSVIAEDADEAHEAIAQLASSRGSDMLEVISEPINPEAGDKIEGFCVQARMTAGTTNAVAV